MKSDAHEVLWPPIVSQNIDIFVCPACGGSLKINRHHLACLSCGHQYQCDGGIPLLFWPTGWGDTKPDVTEAIKSFYEKTPFPNYEDVDSVESLQEKARKGIFAHLLNEQMPFRAKILEAGCGTGQLSNFLAIPWLRTVFATDICYHSLRLGHEFKERNQINNVAFIQMNLFRPAFRPDSFDSVICTGVLHHTCDPFLGFQALSKLVKRGGFIIIGLYHAWGRIPTNIRRFIFRLTGDRFKFLDPRLRAKNLNDLRKHAWFMDQYRNPHESKHTVVEVLRWFDRCGVEFVNSFPKLQAFTPFTAEERLFEAKPRGTRLEHFFAGLGLLLTGGREGGFFIMIGRKV
jgi:SAM-dependent methyltransferase